MPSHDHPQQSPPRLFPRQFGLKTVWMLVSVCGLLFSLAQWLGPMATAAIMFVGLILCGHFLGSTLGTRLRAHGTATSGEAPSGPSPGTQGVMGGRGSRRACVRETPSIPLSAPQRLRQHRSLGYIPWMLSLLGAAAAAALVGLNREFDLGDRIVAAASLAGLGGLAGFAAAAFAQVAIWPAARFFFRGEQRG